MVVVAQLVRASDCGSEGRGFDPHLPPKNKAKAGNLRLSAFFVFHWRGRVQSILYSEFIGHLITTKKVSLLRPLSGKRGSNPRPKAWEAFALPTELFPQSFCKVRKIGNTTKCNLHKKMLLPLRILHRYKA